MICSKPAEAETKDLAKVKGEGAAHSMFKEIRLAEQRIVDGKVFPLILTPNVLLESADAAANLFEANSTFLEQKLKEHGAIFLREFPLQSGEDFDCVVKALGWPSVPYIGSAPRTQVVGSVYTANDSNPQAFINFHHEMAQIIDDASWPSRLIFFCEIPPSEGGQTPIIVSHEVTQSLRKQCPQFLQRLDKQGLLYLKVLPKEKDCRYISLEGWPVVFGTNDPREVQERAKANFNARVEWLPGCKLRLLSGPFEATRKFGEDGQSAWFNMIMTYWSESSHGGGNSSDYPYGVLFGDGSPLPQDAVEACRKIHEENSVDIPWQQGDLMIIDNSRVMHGRRAYKPPRQILVALCK